MYVFNKGESVMILNGIVIADPSKMNRREVLNQHFVVEMKQPGRPLGQFVSEQDKLNNFSRTYHASTGIMTTTKVTIPVTSVVREQLESRTKLERYNNIHADVEKPILEADKNIHDTMKAGAWFDPKTVNPEPEFKETVRPMFRVVRDHASKLAKPYDLVRQFHFIYNYMSGNKGYQAKYYGDNPYKDSKSRIHLFDRPFTRNFA